MSWRPGRTRQQQATHGTVRGVGRVARLAIALVGGLSACASGSSDNVATETSLSRTYSSPSYGSGFYPPLTTAPAPSPQGGGSGTGVIVTRVIDGDTFEVSSGDTIRVLGIDSCESSTAAGGAATSEARRLLTAGPVKLSREPGVTTGGHGRDLRYVELSDGRDFGQQMVTQSHTGVYDGDNDASDAYLRDLRRVNNGRSCGADSSNDSAYYEDCSDAIAAGAAPLAAGDPGYSSDLDADGDGIACESAPGSSSSGSSSSGSSSSGGSAYYRNCDAARAAGVDPLYAGEPGYRSGLDRDDDGIACE